MSVLGCDYFKLKNIASQKALVLVKSSINNSEKLISEISEQSNLELMTNLFKCIRKNSVKYKLDFSEAVETE